MKKRKSYKIGAQRVRPFPVVYMRLRPMEKSDNALCQMTPCQSDRFLGETSRAGFMVQICGAIKTLDPLNEDVQSFSQKELGELFWEKAYREQKAGKEPDAIGYPICVSCASCFIAQFLHDESQERATFSLIGAITTGKDLVLFDRNLSRERTDPALACVSCETLADFRQAYWKAIEEGSE